ncbi:MAG: response regulator [Elusimicrobiota bacterium]|nr:response regulator [Elusimicrobiota bacterium]
MDRKNIRILLIEDEPVSANIALRMLREAGLDSTARVEETLAGGLAVMAAGGADIALLDLSLPDSVGLATVKAVCGKFPGLPVVVMTGTDDEALGLDTLKYGAQDYLVKGQFGDKELTHTLRYAIERKELLNEKEELILKLRAALDRVDLLTGLLPTCADCKKIRTPEGTWVQMESYISSHSDAVFSHGFCEACLKKRLKEIH